MSQEQGWINKGYLLDSLLGQGGMGEIYRATIALVTAFIDKLAFASPSSKSNPRIALAQEFRTLVSLRHPHIVSVLDYGFDEQQQPYYTMTYLEHAQTILASYPSTEEPERRRHLEQAIDIFAMLGAARDLDRARQMLFRMD